MKKFGIILLALGTAVGLLRVAESQTATVVAIVVATCGSPTALFVAGRSAPLTVDTNGQVCQ